MTSIFISHAAHDRPTASEIIEALEAQGLKTWISFRDLRAGKPFDPQIEQALTDASAVVVVWSQSSKASDEVWAEIREALRQNKTVIPVRIDSCELPSRINILQYISWNNKSRAEAIHQLSTALPEVAATQLERYLDRIDELENVRRLIRGWLEMN